MTEDSDTTTTAEEISDQIAELASRRDVLKSGAVATAAGLGLTAGAGGAAASGNETTAEGTEDDKMTEEMEEEEETEEEETEMEEEEGAEVEFLNQPYEGSVITVQETFLPEGGFVAIHDLSLVCGGLDPIDSVIGASELLEAGEHEDVEVPIFESVPGAEFERDDLQETQVLIAMPHMSTNDNETYDFVQSGGEKDGPFVRAGAPVIDSAFVVVE